MEGKTIFPREEKSEILFEKILRDPWACEKLMDTFCNYLFCNDDFDCNLSPEEFTKSLLSAYLDRDMSAFLMSICNNTMFDLLRNSYLIPYRFNADGKTNPVIMTGEHGELLPEFRNSVREKDYQHFHDIYTHMTHNETPLHSQRVERHDDHNGGNTHGNDQADTDGLTADKLPARKHISTGRGNKQYAHTGNNGINQAVEEIQRYILGVPSCDVVIPLQAIGKVHNTARQNFLC